MPIDAALLERIKTNDPTLKTLNLNDKALNDNDIQKLVNALATNTTLTTLDLVDNEIRYEGAKALAANTTLTTLDLGGNKVGDKGAKALAANTTLTTLNVESNNIDYKEEIKLERAIARNNQQLVRRRDQFIQTLMVLARDQVNNGSQSLWSKLSKKLMLYIISFVNFSSRESIGKSAQQINACAEFIFNHILQMNESLTESLKTNQDFKIVEKIAQGKSQFEFFPPKPQIKSLVNTSKQEESMENPNKIQKKI